MAVQLGLALYGFYAIRSFEKYTVPATVLVMAAMTAMAMATTDVNWSLAGTALEPGEKFTGDHPTADRHRNRLGADLDSLRLGLQPVRHAHRVAPRAVFWSSSLGMYVPTVWLAALGACLASAGNGSDPSTLVVGTFGVMAIPVLLLLIHGPIATNILNLYSCSLARAVDRRPGGTLEGHADRRCWWPPWCWRCSSTPTASRTPSTTGWCPSWCGSARGRPSCWSTTLVIRRGALDVGSLYGTEHGQVSTSAKGSDQPGGRASSRAGPGSTAWCPPCRDRWPPRSATPTSRWLSGSLVAGGLYYALNRRYGHDRPLPTVVSATELSNSFLGKLIEICFVTADHRRTMAGLVRLGIGPWRVYTFDSATVTDRTYRGAAADYAIKVLLRRCGRSGGRDHATAVRPVDLPGVPGRPRRGASTARGLRLR